MERSFLIVKPDGVQRGLVGEVIGRLEAKGLKLIGLRLIRMTEAQAQRQYAVHQGKPFYARLLRFMTSGPCVVMAVEGDQAIDVVRLVVGATDPLKAQPGSIRGDFSCHITHNLVHASDSPASVAHELPIFFADADLVPYDLALDRWFYLRE